MRIGAIFPQTEIPGEAAAVRTYVEAVESLGFSHILAYDHVLGSDPAVHVGWAGAYDVTSTFLEPLVLYGFVAAVCQLEVVTGIIILPQRQAVLVAKQAATLDILCNGRLRLGVGIGWNRVEYDALGEDFRTRGQRLEEQVRLMRQLWTEPSVSFLGRYHEIRGAGIAPPPVQRPIPVWFGARDDRRALERVGRTADGWITRMAPGRELDRALSMVREAAAQAGRDASSIGLEGRLAIDNDDPKRMVADLERWQEVGATHLSLDTMKSGLGALGDHIAALEVAAEVLGVADQTI